MIFSKSSGKLTIVSTLWLAISIMLKLVEIVFNEYSFLPSREIVADEGWSASGSSADINYVSLTTSSGSL